MAKAGRPSKYQEEFIAQAAKLCEIGATDLEIADFFGVNVATLNQWKYRHPEFRASIKDHKEPSDNRVERSLYHRAIGYSFDAEKIAINAQGEVTRVKYREHVPPDTAAAFIWLKNRRKEIWRDRHEIDVKDMTFDGIEPSRVVEIREIMLAERARRLDS